MITEERIPIDQLLVGELAARNQDPGSAFQLMLDAARRTRDPALFQRAKAAQGSKRGESNPLG